MACTAGLSAETSSATTGRSVKVTSEKCGSTCFAMMNTPSKTDPEFGATFPLSFGSELVAEC
jgi:hypothetical protein